ncbi:MAG: hypothetical protein ABI595_11160 [Actinomycetota bacterium]
MGEEPRSREDERLLGRAEEALTEIKVSTGLSEPHAAVLAALRIRLKGVADKSLDEMIAAAEDRTKDRDGPQLDEVAERAPSKPSASLEDLLSRSDQPKRSLDDLLG